MRSSWKTLVAAVATALVVPQLATADEVQEAIEQMQDRMSQLEDKLAATNEELEVSKSRVEQQQDLIEKAGLDERPAGSFLSRFLEQTEFDGWVAASWGWNFAHPNDQVVALGNVTGGVNRGGVVTTAPFHPDHNTFSLDQIWFAMRKEATPESRAGFGLQMTYGKTGDILGNARPGQELLGLAGASVYNIGNGNELYIFEGYVEYLAPILPDGINIKLGRMGTNIGYETIRQVDQAQITRGILWGLQPVSHTGLQITVPFMDDFEFMIGAVNGLNDYNFEVDNEKTMIGSLRYNGDMFGVSLNGLFGGDTAIGPGGAARSADSVGILDLVVTVDPTDSLHLWGNFDYIWTQDDLVNRDQESWGIAGGGRLAITEQTGFSLRGEYIQLKNVFAGGGAVGGANAPDDDQSQFAITGTLDHALTDQLTLKVEGRYDKAFQDGAANNFFTCGGAGGNALTGGAISNCAAGQIPGALGFGTGAIGNSKQDQVLALVELLYRF